MVVKQSLWIPKSIYWKVHCHHIGQIFNKEIREFCSFFLFKHNLLFDWHPRLAFSSFLVRYKIVIFCLKLLYPSQKLNRIIWRDFKLFSFCNNSSKLSRFTLMIQVLKFVKLHLENLILHHHPSLIPKVFISIFRAFCCFLLSLRFFTLSGEKNYYMIAFFFRFKSLIYILFINTIFSHR